MNEPGEGYMQKLLLISLLVLTGGFGADIAERYFLQGDALMKAGDLRNAIAEFDRAVSLEPTVAIYRFALGSAYGKNQEFDPAILQLKKAVALDPQLADAYYLIEDYSARLDRIDEAIVYFQDETDKFPSLVPAIVNLGHLYYRQKDFDRALTEFSRAQILAPDDPTVMCAMGVTALAKGEDSIAAFFFMNARQLDTLYAEAHLYYSLVLERQGMKSEAMAVRAIAFRLKPSLRELDLSLALPLRGEKADIPFILSTLDLIVDKLIRPEERRMIMAQRKPFNLNLGLGFAKIGTEPWLALSSAPEMDRDWLGFKLALGFYFNQDGDVRTKEFDPRKILQNVRVGHPNLPLHLGFGVVQDHTLGYGLIVRNYFNQADENNLKLGGILTLQNPSNTIGLTGMAGDVPNFPDSSVIAGHAFFGRWAPEPEDAFQRFEFGLTYAQDQPNRLQALGGDLLVYIAARGAFNFLGVGEFAKIMEHGQGGMGGVLLHIGGLSASDFSLSLFGGGLFLGRDFVPAPFDAFYEKNRRQFAAAVADSLLAGYQESAAGVYSMAGVNFGPTLRISADLQSVTGVPGSGVFSARAAVGEKIPYIRLQGFFYKYHFDDLGTLTTMDEDTYIAGLAGIKLIPNLLSINFVYERTYVWQNGAYDVQEKVSPYVQFGARF
jgi:tetratricopeptide (TPR) repeat protein